MLNSLKISNLPLKVGEAEIDRMFSLIGNVKDVKVLLDTSSGVSLGVALVEMSTEDEAKDCILHYNGKTIDGHSIFVRENRPHVINPSKKRISDTNVKTRIAKK